MTTGIHMPSLKHLDITPPGGFSVVAPHSDIEIIGDTFSWCVRQLIAHVTGNGYPMEEDEAEELVNLGTAKRLMEEGFSEWIQ